MSTNIRFGELDYELRIRPHPNHPQFDPDHQLEWQFITPIILPANIPDFDFSQQQYNVVKAPGRPVMPSPPIHQEEIVIDQSASQGGSIAAPPAYKPTILRPAVPFPKSKFTSQNNKDLFDTLAEISAEQRTADQANLDNAC